MNTTQDNTQVEATPVIPEENTQVEATPEMPNSGHPVA